MPKIPLHLLNIRNLFAVIHTFLERNSQSSISPIDSQIVNQAIHYITQYLHSDYWSLDAIEHLSRQMQSGGGSVDNIFAQALNLSGKQIEVGTQAMKLTSDIHFHKYVTETSVQAIARYFIALGSEHQSALVRDLGYKIIETWRDFRH